MTTRSAKSDYIRPEAEAEEEGCLLNLSNDEDEWDKNSPNDGQYPTPKALRNDSRTAKPFVRTARGICLITVIPVFLLAVSLMGYRNNIRIARLRLQGIPPGVYSKEGKMYVGHERFYIKGFSWYGMEEPGRLPGGLNKVSIDHVFEFARNHEFNAIRLPLSVENIVNNEIVHTNAFKNPELTGLAYLDVVKSVIRKAADNNILILLDAHRLQTNEVFSKGLWYSAEVHEERLFFIWKTLCKAVGNEWNVLGADIYNEPWDAEWNSSNPKTDWKRASEKLGDHVHRWCPSWLIFIEGVGGKAGKTKTGTFWAENLRAMQDSPPILQLKNKVVLSPHVYGPSVYNQTYFKGDDFAEKMPEIWDDHFGKASEASGLATVVGEWGGWYVGKDKTWQQAFFKYMAERQISWFYWCLNPESGDTGGLLMPDWVTPHNGKLELIARARSTPVAELVVHFRYWRHWRV